MFINDVHRKEEIRNIAVQDLKQLGIKYRSKKPRQHVQESRSRKLFKTHLQSLPMEIVTLPSGQQLIVPKIVHELCSYIVTKIDTEGIFRKGGSKSRQNEIRLSLDAGCYLGDEHHEIDVASILKTFFRELPEPLIPYSYHELFLRCTLLPKNQIGAVLLSCLLLPTEHLNTLAYFMQFLYRVSEYMKFNKMDAYNLAVVIGPTLLPAEEKLPHGTAQQRLLRTCELFKLLIENASDIGVLSESIIERVALTSSSHSLNGEEDAMSIKKKKKRRSGSLTRMFSGLKKIVTNKIEEVAQTPDLLMTPSLTRSAKKRKVESNGLSTKKRREILSNLPHNAILNTPYTPARTPVNCHPDGNKKSSPESSKPEMLAKEKRLLWSTRSKPNKKLPEEATTTGPTSIQRRWSAVSSAAGFKKKKTRNSCAGTMGHPKPKIVEKDPQIDNRINDLSEELTKKKSPDDENYVRISKIEYEDIKNRVTAIERRISIELDQVVTPADECEPVNGLDNVEKAYVETLVQAEPMSPTTDQLARRLSRELKIRRSSDQRVFRSPSARKIGSMRRRSKEGNQVRLTRTQTWCVSSAAPKSALKRGRPNTVLSGLPQPSTDDKMEVVQDVQPLQRVTRSSSFQGDVIKSPNNTSKNISSSLLSNASSTSWKSAQGFFNTPLMSSPSFENCRASLAKLRSQNAGMVLAKARLFDNLVDSGGSSQAEEVPVARPNRSHKIGAPRAEARQSCRVRTLRMEDRRSSKKMMSPRKRSCKSPGGARMHKLQSLRSNISGGTDESLYIRKVPKMVGSQSPQFTTPRSVPHIKRPLNTKSPRRICRTPNAEGRQTPLKVVTQMKDQY